MNGYVWDNTPTYRHKKDSVTFKIVTFGYQFGYMYCSDKVLSFDSTPPKTQRKNIYEPKRNYQLEGGGVVYDYTDDL